ncbi:head-tail adaptor protein [Bacillus sp. AFS002410]|uniref:phage head closure protein n=1 Tax=Bacillus sp. AFS002410 TaxID=2033481 RepID=UPI000BF210C6|nr:phage head closure protein [Bacillus sp. AFS002410]PEJ48233.1 head-tail adaptor protein [Bacillus sp. AFS002410]
MQPFKYNPNFNSGSFRHKITFQKEAESGIVDELDQKEDIWENVKSVWSMIKTIKGSEYLSTGTTQATIISRFIIRYTDGITSDMRIMYNNRLFDIIEPPINDDEAYETLTILAKERV